MMYTITNNTIGEIYMNFIEIYFDLLINLFTFLTFELFIYYFSKNYKNELKIKMRIIFLLIYFFYSIIPTIPMHQIIDVVLYFVYIVIITKQDLTAKIFLFIKFYLFYAFTSFLVVSVTLLLTNDLSIIYENEMYLKYRTLIGIIIIYILLSLYINWKRISNLQKKSPYRMYYTFIIILSIAALIFTNMLLGSNIIKQQDAMPIIIFIIIIIILAILSSYRSIIHTLEKETLYELQLEKTRMEQEYYEKIEQSLNNLSRLRHDFKNHLIIIDGYAQKENLTEIKNYIAKITDYVSENTIITTPNNVISSILNAKNQDCIRNEISFQFSFGFKNIYVDDTTLTVILGNILDNAITAASKMNVGYINLSINQIDSYLEINCTNNHKEKLKMNKGNFFTTKKTNNLFHGIGLNNVSTTVSRLNGTIDTEYDDFKFRINILIPNYM